LDWLFSLLANLSQVVESHVGAMVAVATVFIAVFTVTIALVTERLARLTRASISLARSEFVATHRPKIVARAFVTVRDDDRSAVRFSYANVGVTPATVTVIGGIIAEHCESGTSLPASLLDPPIKLASGQRREWQVEMDPDPSAPAIRPGDSTVHRRAYCIGYILYKDAHGRTRQTGFCRERDGATGRWLRQTESEYEYDD
jgi:hypothetical protein